MPVLEISELVFARIDKSLHIGTKINPTQIVRAALLLLKQSNLTKEQLFSLIGQTSTEETLIDSLEDYKK